MSDVSPQKLVASHQRGMLTDTELVLRLIEAAVHHPPEEILPLVPVELRQEVMQRGMNPPERPEDILVIQAGSYSGPYDASVWERKQREQQVAYYEGAWRWHRFLTNQHA